MLLEHRAGLFDYRTLLELRDYIGPLYVTRREIAMLAVAQGGPAVDLDQYSNTGYVLLRMALEAATGMSIEQCWREATGGREDIGFWVTNPELPIASRAWGYRQSVSGFARLWSLAADDAGASNYWGTVAEAMRLAEFIDAAYRCCGVLRDNLSGPYGAAAVRSDGWLATGADGGFSAAVFVDNGRSRCAAVTNRCDTSAIDLVASYIDGDEFQIPAYGDGIQPSSALGRLGHAAPADGIYHHDGLRLSVEMVTVDGHRRLRAGRRVYDESEVWAVAEGSNSMRLSFGHLRGVRLVRVA